MAELLWAVRAEAGDWTAPDARPVPADPVDRPPALGARRLRRRPTRCGPTCGPAPWHARPAAIGRRAGRRRRAGAARARPAGASDGGAPGRAAGPRRPPTVPADAVNAALVLLADHELATSTVAVRVAASVRADPYDALLAGLATLAGPLHGGASQQAYELLVVAERDGAARALERRAARDGAAARLRAHRLQERRPALRRRSWRWPSRCSSDERRALVHEVIALAAAHDMPQANCDLALAALGWGTGMPPDAGRTIFAVARVAGWAAHYLEELAERPLRFRARAVYSALSAPRVVGPRAARVTRPDRRWPTDGHPGGSACRPCRWPASPGRSTRPAG